MRPRRFRGPLLAALVASAGAAAMLSVTPARAAAQDLLARAEDFLWEGDAAAARRELEAWFARSWRSAPGDQRGRAYLLRARLADPPSLAERDYLEVVHGYPDSPAAPEALLRLGQWTLARGESERAVAYLDRLLSDYPTWRRHGEGLVWAARARRATGRARAACDAAAAAALSDDPWVARLGRAEAELCS